MTLVKSTICITLAAFLFGACNKQSQAEDDTPSFLTTLDIHLNAIKTSNLEQFRPTVDDNVSMISPDGKKGEVKNSFFCDVYELENGKVKEIKSYMVFEEKSLGLLHQPCTHHQMELCR